MNVKQILKDSVDRLIGKTIFYIKADKIVSGIINRNNPNNNWGYVIVNENGTEIDYIEYTTEFFFTTEELVAYLINEFEKNKTSKA